MEIIRLDGVGYTYGDGHQALADISFGINRGERVAFLGPNGAGKSTLFQLLNGLLTATKGAVTVKGMAVRKENLREIRTAVGMVFQDPDDQLFSSTVRQEIAYGLRNMGVKGQALEDAAAWALDVVGLRGYEDKTPHNLSGGEKKKVALASVLAMKPEVLVLDEPTASLDPMGASRLIALLRAINRDFGITLILATHDVDIVPLVAERVHLLSEGRIEMSGTAQEVFANREVMRQHAMRLPRVAHLAELLIRDGLLTAADLPLTIGQAKRQFEKQSVGGLKFSEAFPTKPKRVPDG